MRGLANQFEPVVPFGVAAISFTLADINAIAALLLTTLGIVYTSRKLWLSFRNKPRRQRSDHA